MWWFPLIISATCVNGRSGRSFLRSRNLLFPTLAMLLLDESRSWFLSDPTSSSGHFFLFSSSSLHLRHHQHSQQCTQTISKMTPSTHGTAPWPLSMTLAIPHVHFSVCSSPASVVSFHLSESPPSCCLSHQPSVPYPCSKLLRAVHCRGARDAHGRGEAGCSHHRHAVPSS